MCHIFEQVDMLLLDRQQNQNELIFRKLKFTILISRVHYASEIYFTINKLWTVVC